MAEDGTDILMQVVKGGKALSTQGTIEVSSGNTLLLGTSTVGGKTLSSLGSTTTSYLIDFGLAVGTSSRSSKKKDEDDEEEEDGKGTRDAGKPAAKPAATGQAGRQEPRASPARPEDGKAAKTDDKKKKKNKVPPGEPQPVSFRRRLDAFSGALLTTLVAGEELDGISIFKRKATGGETSGDVFLRLDFAEVLLVSLDWKDDDEGVEEEGKFVYRHVRVQYCPQKPGGDLDAAVSGTWSATVAGGSSQGGR